MSKSYQERRHHHEEMELLRTVVESAQRREEAAAAKRGLGGINWLKRFRRRIRRIWWHHSYLEMANKLTLP